VSEFANHTWNENERRWGEIPCQSCGEIVSVMLPFAGCAFCANCSAANQYSYSEEWHGHKEG
jgi:hypothetical protein